jgi:hypothetical protein
MRVQFYAKSYYLEKANKAEVNLQFMNSSGENNRNIYLISDKQEV